MSNEVTSTETNNNENNSDNNKRWSNNNVDTFIGTIIDDFGGIQKNGGKKAKFVYRQYLTQGNKQNDNEEEGEKKSENPFYFGFIADDNNDRQSYHDLSLVVFPDTTNEYLMVTLTMGSEKCINDFDIISRPGIRRLFCKYLNLGEQTDNTPDGVPKNNQVWTFIKSDFSDWETNTGIKDFLNKIKDDNGKKMADSFKPILRKYGSVILAATIIKKDSTNLVINKDVVYYKKPDKKEDSSKDMPDEKEDLSKDYFVRYLALYAMIRQWKKRDDYKDYIKLPKTPTKEKSTETDPEQTEVKKLLENRRFVVLQGPPGTGKTRMARNIAEALEVDPKKIFFTQFHAETSYSDFVYGIMPDLNSDSLKYKPKEGKLVEAIRAAINAQEGVANIKDAPKVLLIIDEINRANLAHVLGPVFYLFELNMEEGNVEIEIVPSESDGLTLKKLPDNLYVIATMNTADRSLAVVDFALRRRFAWYTIMPHTINKTDKGTTFCEDEFSEMEDIFFEYASDEELNLQPGHAYFIVKPTEKATKELLMKERMKYELMPLIKEYLMDGVMLSAKDAFEAYFRKYVGEELFK